MYDVYIKHFKRNDTVVDNEELMFTIPSSEDFPVNKPVVKSSEDSADQFSFSMETNSPYYDSILPKKTEIRVEYDGDIIFYGTAQAPSTSTVFQTKNVMCIGKYAYLNDTFYEGKQEKHRGKITISDYLNRIISNHNTMAPLKPFARGNISVSLPSKLDKYEPTSWTQSSSLLNNLTSNHGGHIRARYTSGDTTYIDWYKYYVRDLGDGNRPQVEVGKNILDISSDTGLDNIFTRVIPVGDTDKNGKSIYLDGYVYTDKYGETHRYSGKVMPVSFIRNVYTNAQLTDEFRDFRDYANAETNFGVIYKPMTFSDCDTQAKLFSAVTKWIKDSYFGLVPSFAVKAIDMHIQNTEVPKILLGDCVDVTYRISINGNTTTETKKLVCKAISYDLFNPENNTYTFGIPSDLLEYNRNNKKSSKKPSVAGSSSQRVIPKGDDDNNITWRKIWRMIGDQLTAPDYDSTEAYISFGDNGELSGTKKCYDPNEVIDGNGTVIGNNYKDHKDKWFTAKIVGKITLPGKTVKWVAFSNDRGVFAYVDTGEPSAVTHWYLQKKGLTYDGEDPGLSSFNKIAEIIEKDSDTNWGGTTAADSFRNNKKMSGCVRFFDPDKCTRAQAIADPKNVYTADIVGKFTLNGVLRYVAISKEFGIFGYNSTVKPPVPASHWYMQAKGLSYDNIDTLIKDENGEVYSTDDDTPDGKKTVWIRTKQLTGKGSQGEILVGYDTTGQGDNWKIKLNVPIQYTDAQGNIKTADGFVSASDFNLESIPSFKTKVAVIDAAFIGVVYSHTIQSEIAYINKINSNNITANTYVSAHYGNYDIVSTGDVRAQDYEYHYGDEGVSHLQKCYSNFYISESNGVITLTMYPADGSRGKSIPFDMANTSFFQDAVKAAKDQGAAAIEIRAVASVDPGLSPDRTLNPGAWVKAYGAYKDKNGTTKTTSSVKWIKARPISLRKVPTAIVPGTTNTPVGKQGYDGLDDIVVAGDADLIPANIKSGVRIFNVDGSYTGSGGSASDIQLYAGGSGEIVRSTTAPSGAIALSALSSTLIGAYQNLGGAGQFVKFPATINGGTGVKYYYLDMRH